MEELAQTYKAAITAVVSVVLQEKIVKTVVSLFFVANYIESRRDRAYRCHHKHIHYL